MPKTIVCIIEEEAILNYLFIKEMYSSGDEILLITQHLYIPNATYLKGLFKDITTNIITLAKDGDEDIWDTICKTIRAKLTSEVEYVVNLSGGTRLMSIAVQQVFEKFNAKFYFMPIDRNTIIHSQIDDNNDNNDDVVIDIKHRVTIDEYLTINNINCKRRVPTQTQEYSEHFLMLFTQNMLSNNDYDIIDKLRRNQNKFVKYSTIDGAERFIKYIGFTPQTNDGLTRDEMKYIAGGWFEEYIYYKVSSIIKPNDIATGVVIQRTNNHNNDINELDVVFTLNNRLFVVECKTGVGRAGLYHEIVYKACALRESLLGTRSNAYIFSLNDDPKNRLKTTARNMDITYCDKTFAIKPRKMENLFLNSKLYMV